MSKRKNKWNECNVVHVANQAATLWQFQASDKNFAPKTEVTEQEGTPLPSKIVGKTWRNLLQPKLNIGWLPEEKVFLRTVQLPDCEPEELQQMLEFQLEKLSPAPVSQIVWSYELIPSAETGQTTVLLVIVEADVIEEQLSGFEQWGFYADRLEIPWCHELVTLDRQSDRVWIRLEEVNDHMIAMVVWVLNQTVQNVMIQRLPNSDEGTLALTEQLDRTAWTGELEAWLSTIPAVTVCGDEEQVAPWVAALSEWSDHPVNTEPAASRKDNATLGAQRAILGKSRTDLLPEERRTRYRQLYIDGMWMKGVGTMVMLYLFGLVLYFIALEYKRSESINFFAQVRMAGTQATNVMEMEARVSILQEQEDLRYSALECLRIISEELPTELTLTNFKFQKGETLTLFGKVPSADSQKVSEYNLALINAKIGEAKLFEKVSSPSISPTRARGRTASTESTWNFTCTLARTGF